MHSWLCLRLNVGPWSFEHLIVERSEFSQAETEGLKVWKWAILIFTLLHILTFAYQMHLTFKWWLLSHSLKFKIYYPSEQSELNKSYLWRGFNASLHNCPLPSLGATLTLLVCLVYLVSHLMASLGNIQVGPRPISPSRIGNADYFSSSALSQTSRSWGLRNYTPL